MSTGLYQFLRGLIRNLGNVAKLKQEIFPKQIQNLDAKADTMELDEEEWDFRYHLEEQLLQAERKGAVSDSRGCEHDILSHHYQRKGTEIRFWQDKWFGDTTIRE